MTIGEALLNLRKQLGLTQTEMATNVVSTSFYSKVERNIHDIGTNDLLQILNKHQINATYFFENLNDKENISEDIMDKISVAFEQKSRDKLLKIKQEIDLLPNNRQTEYYKLQLQLTLEVYLPKAKEIPIELKNKLKQYILVNNNWNIHSLQIFRETMRIYDIDELNFLVGTILAKYSNPNILQNSLQECIGAICINYLDNCYEKNSTKLIQEVLSYISTINSKGPVLFIKLLGKYYASVFQKDPATCQEITKVLKLAGYSDFVSMLPKI